MEGINCSSVDVFSLRLGAFLEKVIFCITGFMSSLETTLNAGFQADLQAGSVEGSKFWTGCVMVYISISILYFPKLCLGSHQILNLSHPTKREES